MTAEQLQAEVDRLKAVAEQHERKQARARAVEEKARLELESTTDKLENLFGTVSWAAAEQLLPTLKAEAEEAVTKVKTILEGAGLV